MRGKLRVLILLVCSVPLLAVGCAKTPEATYVPPAEFVQQDVPQNVLDEAVASFASPMLTGVTARAATERDFEEFSGSTEDTAHTKPGVSAKELHAQLSAKYPKGKVYAVLASGGSYVLSAAWAEPVLVVDTGITDGEGNRMEVFRTVLALPPSNE